jgi:hypothetical protein
MALSSRISRIFQPLLVVLSLLISAGASSQTISANLFGQNAWMPDTIGSNVLNGKLHTKWATVAASGARMVRFGGITADRDRPTNYQYIKMIDSVRARGMEPIIQVSYHAGDYTAAQAAQLVQYINGTMSRNVKYWSIGNEPDLEYSYTTASQVAVYFKPFASAMKAADPSIKIIGPETAWYNQSIIHGLTTPGGASDITGTDTAGRYYVDIISFHTYPFNGSQTRAQLIPKLTASPGFDSYLNTLSARVASCNTAHGRTGTNALKTAVTELNVSYQNASTDDVNGTGVNSFIGGQFVAEMFGLGMKNNVDMMTMWSVIEGNSTALNIGYLDRTTGNKKPVYHHFKMMADHFSGNYVSSASTHTNVKVFSSKNSSLTTVMIMNQDLTSNLSYAVRLDNAVITATNPLKINVNAGIAQMYYNVIPNQSSVLLQFNAQGAIVKKVTYTIAQALTGGTPTVSIYTPTTMVAAIAAPLNSTQPGNLVMCSGSTTTLTATAGTNTVKWYGSLTSTLVLATGSVYVTPVLNAAGTASYYAQAVNATTVSARTPVTVTVNPAPAIAVNSGSICAGSVFTMTPAGAVSYTFSSGSATVTPLSSAYYSVSGTSSAGCISTQPAIAQVTVQAVPVVSVNSGSLCAGEIFTMVPSGAMSYTYSSGSATVSPSVTSTYSVTGSNTAGCISAPELANVTVSTPSITMSSGAICEGSSFTLSPSGASTYTFSSGSGIVSPAATSTYAVLGTGANGCVASSWVTATVTVHPGPLITASSGSICAGSYFTIVPSGAVTYSISGSSFTVSPSSTTAYTISGTSAYGCGSSTVSTVSVQPLPVVSVASGSICKGGSYTLSPSGATSYTYSCGSPVVSPNTNTSYTVWGAAGGCTGAPAVAYVTVKSRRACNTELVVQVTSSPYQAIGEPTIAVVTASMTTGAETEPVLETSGVADSTLTTGITTDAVGAAALLVYPNPNAGEFNIAVEQESVMTVLGLSGAVIRTTPLRAGTNAVNIADLPAGIYLLRVTSGEKVEFARVITR